MNQERKADMRFCEACGLRSKNFQLEPLEEFEGQLLCKSCLRRAKDEAAEDCRCKTPLGRRKKVMGCE